MSNWSVVSIMFSGLEAVEPYDLPLYNCSEGPWFVTPACDADDAPGYAVEWVMTTHCNHFDVEDMRDELRKTDWKYPGEVAIVWKNEYMDLPCVEGLFT